jgi:ferrochelatase
MAYGTPGSEEDMEPYLTDIRRGRKPTQEAVENLKERYRKIGGRSPLLEITNAQASALEKSLRNQGLDARAYVGMKHWHPYIREVFPQIVSDGFQRMIALVLAPHYSQISIGGYKQALDHSLGSGAKVEVAFIESWHDNVLFHRAVAEKIEEGLEHFSEPRKVEVLFTAHSLPERILEQKDPYPTQLLESCEAVAQHAKLGRWSFAYQSAGETGEKWLGPDILEALQIISLHPGSSVLVVPIGFVADHLEILYDIDVEAQELARTHGLNLRRVESLNASSAFISALVDVVSKRANLNHWS